MHPAPRASFSTQTHLYSFPQRAHAHTNVILIVDTTTTCASIVAIFGQQSDTQVQNIKIEHNRSLHNCKPDGTTATWPLPLLSINGVGEFDLSPGLSAPPLSINGARKWTSAGARTQPGVSVATPGKQPRECGALSPPRRALLIWRGWKRHLPAADVINMAMPP